VGVIDVLDVIVGVMMMMMMMDGLGGRLGLGTQLNQNKMLQENLDSSWMESCNQQHWKFHSKKYTKRGA